MDYNILLDNAVDLGYELAMGGAETYRVEESINRILATYGVESEVFSIPNCLIVSIETPDGKPLTRMRRIGYHGNDLNKVEQFSGLSRAICNRKPEPNEIRTWINVVRGMNRQYCPAIFLLGNFLGAAGFTVFCGGTLLDSLWGGLCGIIIGLVTLFMGKLKANQFFTTLAASFLMAIASYGAGAFGLTARQDMVTIGALMLLVPGLLFTNAMRDIIFGDTNSGTNRIVQVFLIAVAIVLGTAAAWSIAANFWGTPTSAPGIEYPLVVQCLGAFVACIGFSILFNIRGPGMVLCSIGGIFAWAVYGIVFRLTGSDIAGFFWSAVAASLYSEIMARVRKCPAIAYVVVAIFPMIPGAGIYYTMNYAVLGEMTLFAEKGIHTASVAGVIAVGILLISTAFRMIAVHKQMTRK